MTRRIVVPCNPEGTPYRRHRWQWRDVYGDPEHPVKDRWCERCGNWWLDVLEDVILPKTTPVAEFTLAEGTAVSFEPLDNGLPGFRLAGMRDVQGTFEGKLNEGGFAAMNPGPIEVFLYGPATLPWWKNWFYRLRENLRGTPYPSVLIAKGPATFNIESEVDDGGDVVISGTFTKTGKWSIDEEVNTK